MKPVKKVRAWAVVNSDGEIGNAISFKRRKPTMEIYSVNYKPIIKDYYEPDTRIVEVEITPVKKKRRKKRMSDEDAARAYQSCRDL